MGKKLLSAFLIPILLLSVGYTLQIAKAATPATETLLPTEIPDIQLTESNSDLELLKVTGQVGGPTQAVAVQGNYAYVGVGLRLVVLDITEPATPLEVGATQPFSWYVEDVAVIGETAIVAAGSGLYTVNISNSANPTFLGSYETIGYAEGVAITGNYAYVADGSAGLRVVDISDLASPVEVARSYSLNYAFDVAVENNYVYIAAAGAGLLVADISDPMNPMEIGSLDTLGYAYGLAVSGNTSYLADGWGGLRVIDVSDQAHPVEVGFQDNLGSAFDIAVKDDIAYVGGGSGGIRVLDVRNPTNLVELGNYSATGGFAAGLVINDHFLYVTDRSAGLRVIDVQNSALPVQVSLYSPMGFADDAVVAGNYAYVAAGSYGLRVVDISDPARPREIVHYDIQGYAWCIAVGGNYAYVASLPTGTSQGRLYVIDISNPAFPTQVAYVEPTYFPPRNMVIVGDILYGANEWGLVLFDISDPRAPAQLSFIDLHTGIGGQPATTDVVVLGNMAYVAQSEGGLQVVDVSDPRNPTLAGVFNSSNILKVLSVAGVDDTVFLGDHGRLQVVDVSNPRNPVGVGFYQVPGIIDKMALAGDTLYLAAGATGVHAVNIFNRRAPALTASRYMPGYVPGLAVSGNYVYVAAEDGGLFVLERDTSFGTPSTQSANTLASGERSAQVATISNEAPSPQNVPPVRWTRSENSPTGRPPADDRGAITASPQTANAPYSANGSVLTVTSNTDSGPGTLRWALENAGTGDTITFDVAVFPPTNPTSINISSPLPRLTQGSLTIDAGSAGVILNGVGTPAGFFALLITSDSNIIKGLQVKNFSQGVHISNAKGNVIGGDRTKGQGPLGEGNLLSGNGDGVGIFGSEATGNRIIGNYIGTDITGTSAFGNHDRGVSLTGGASYNLIGGVTPGERNIISGNEYGGVVIADEGTAGNRVFGNYIGLDVSGTCTLGHLDSGVFIEHGASGNIIGGTTPSERNVVSGNRREEIGLMAGAHNNVIVGNYIGTDASGSVNLGISYFAVTMELGPYNNIIQGNVISTNSGIGVMLSDWGTWGNAVIGNFIGIDATGTFTLGGAGGGIAVNASYNRIGGTTPAEQNVISGNGNVGIKIGLHSTTEVLVLGNLIGTDISGTKVVGNNGHGIIITEGTRHSFIGGLTNGERNVISGNNGSGVALEGTGVRYNFIIGNLIGTDTRATASLGNQSGLEISYAEYNSVIGNLMAHNHNEGVLVRSNGDNLIHHNSLIDNGQNGADQGQSNQWHLNGEGNYWSDYSGVDINEDGIGDVPHEIPGGAGAKDMFPLMTVPLPVPGDANGDGSVNALDITKVERIIVRLDALTLGADATRDNKVNAIDITKVERLIAALD